MPSARIAPFILCFPICSFQSHGYFPAMRLRHSEAWWAFTSRSSGPRNGRRRGMTCKKCGAEMRLWLERPGLRSFTCPSCEFVRLPEESRDRTIRCAAIFRRAFVTAGQRKMKGDFIASGNARRSSLMWLARHRPVRRRQAGRHGPAPRVPIPGGARHEPAGVDARAGLSALPAGEPSAMPELRITGLVLLITIPRETQLARAAK